MEGCTIHHNFLGGIVVYGGDWHCTAETGCPPYEDGDNVIADNRVFANSDAGLDSSDGYYANGGNADGISVSSGRDNTIIHNSVDHNSDDGIDVWRSNDSYIAFNLVSHQGQNNGDGNGIKAGGNPDPDATNGLRAVVKHNIAFANRANGIDHNAGKSVLFMYNTSYGNGGRGFTSADDSTLIGNIAAENGRPTLVMSGHRDNSWQMGGQVEFISTTPASTDFLRPAEGSPFADMGANAHIPGHQPNMPIFILGDSTVKNDGENIPDYPERGWGEMLGSKLVIADNCRNRAQSGASSRTYRENTARPDNWPRTRADILDTDLSSGGYLLIQFGHNDEMDEQDGGTLPGRHQPFYNYLKGYVDEARDLGLTPVLVTPVERMWKEAGQDTVRSHITGRGDYAQTVRDLAADEGVLLLDLEQKSWSEFNRYTDSAAIMAEFAHDDHTHFSPDGARTVAEWVRELACASVDEALCDQFR